jgi:proteic killer suppression protein
MKSTIQLTEKFKKQIKKVPSFIVDAAQVWIDSVNEIGLDKTNELPGYRAHHLKGERKGERSVSLNKSYRIIYTVENGEVQIVRLQEINKHKY